MSYKIYYPSIIILLLIIRTDICFSQFRKENIGIQILYNPSLSNFEIQNYNETTIGIEFRNLYESNGLNRMLFGYSGGVGINYRLKHFLLEFNYLATKRGQQSGKNYNIKGIQTYPEDYDGYNLIVEQFSHGFNLDIGYFLENKKNNKIEIGFSSGFIYDCSDNFFQNFFIYSKKDGLSSGPSEKLSYKYSYSAKRIGFDLGCILNYKIVDKITFSTGINYKFLSKIVNSPEYYMPNGFVNTVELKNRIIFTLF